MKETTRTSIMKMCFGLTLIALLLTFCTGCNSENLQPLQAGTGITAPQTVTMQIMNYVPQTGNTFKDLFVSNFSVKAQQGQLLLMTARDGLPDTLKQQLAPTYGFTVGDSAYSVNPGFSDLILSLMGVTLQQQNLLTCATALQGSTSNDAFNFTDTRNGAQAFLGLRDCEKQYLGLDSTKWDNNGNGIPDYLKIRCGLNPKDTYDSKLNIAADGVTNYDKCKQHLPPDESATSQANQLFAYQYNFQTIPQTSPPTHLGASPSPSPSVYPGGTPGTSTLKVSNIPILNGGQDNFIAFYLTEVNLATNVTTLYTAFTILGPNSNGLILKFNYWATDASHTTNQQIVIPTADPSPTPSASSASTSSPSIISKSSSNTSPSPSPSPSDGASP
jgi:hypothetical protein